MVIFCTEIKIYSELRMVKKVIKEIVSYLESEFSCISCDDIFELRLVFSELINNAVIHGNKNDFSKEVRIVIEFEEGYVSSTIRDEGNGFNYFDVLERKNLFDFHGESGRGLQLVKSLSDDLEFNELGNEVRFKKCFSMHI